MNHVKNDIECNNTIKPLALWTFAWLLSLAFAAFAPKYLWDYHVVLSIGAIVINLGFGTGMMLANRRHLNALDEMQQKIQTDAMAITLSAGLILACSYETFANIGLLSFDASISHLVMTMSLIYLGATISIGAKYR